MHRRIPAVVIGMWIAAASAWAQQRPLRTDDAETVALGRVRGEFGIEFLQKQRYPLSGLEGDLVRAGVIGLHFGVGDYAEIQLSGVTQDFFSVSKRSDASLPPTFSGNSTSDFGDLTLAAKLRLAKESGARPAVGFKFSVQLPNASNESGLGTDETNFYASLLMSKHVRRLWLHANVGVAILGSAVVPNTQSDMLTYGVAAIVPIHLKLNLVAEVNGRQGPERIGNESLAQARAGIQIHAGGLRWDVAGIAGLKRFDADSGVTLGVTYEFQGFHRKKRVKTVQ